MRKNETKSPMGAIKVVSILLTVVMTVFCLTACSTNNTVYGEGAGQPTEENPYISEVPGIDEPNMPIDPGADIDVDPTTEVTVPDGQYTYTLYGKTISMDVNIEDYLGVNSAGTKIFYLPRLLFDLGWRAGDYTSMEELGNNSFPRRWWYYGENDLAIMIDAGSHDSGQFGQLNVNYIIRGSLPFEAYYSDNSVSHLPYYCTVLDHSSNCEYAAAGGLGGMSYEDIVFVTYILWAEANNPGNNAMVSTFGENFSYATFHSDKVNYDLP